MSFPRISSSQTIDDRFRLAFGIQGGDIGPSIVLKAGKKIRLLQEARIIRGKEILSRCWDLELGGRWLHNPQQRTWNLQLKALATMAVFRLNRNMDVRIRGKLCVPMDKYGLKTIIPVLSMEENCWSLQTTGRDWKVFYKL